MGKYNSSTYRVTPLMKYIENDLNRINKFLSIFNLSVDSLPTEYFYGDEEKLLKPTFEHLKNLIIYLGSTNNHIEKDVSEDRKKLFYGSTEERNKKASEAINELRKSYDKMTPFTKKWFILEGYTHPDVFIEGKDYILIGEGKWTEDEITTHTEHLLELNGEYRNQMIRHIQAALNYSSKKVYAFYLVDKECGYLDELTKEAFFNQLSKETVALPDNEKKKISEAFYGYTTWQDLKAIFPQIEFLSKEEIDKINK